MERFGRLLPDAAAWRHEMSREGFEVVDFDAREDTIAITGHAALVIDGAPLWVRYAIELDPGWRTRRAHVHGGSPAGERETLLEADGAGAWRVDGAAAPHLDGILDVDLEASAMTNAFPVHRLRLEQASRPRPPRRGCARTTSPSSGSSRRTRAAVRMRSTTRRSSWISACGSPTTTRASSRCIRRSPCACSDGDTSAGVTATQGRVVCSRSPDRPECPVARTCCSTGPARDRVRRGVARFLAISGPV